MNRCNRQKKIKSNLITKRTTWMAQIHKIVEGGKTKGLNLVPVLDLMLCLFPIRTAVIHTERRNSGRSVYPNIYSDYRDRLLPMWGTPSLMFNLCVKFWAHISQCDVGVASCHVQNKTTPYCSVSVTDFHSVTQEKVRVSVLASVLYLWQFPWKSWLLVSRRKPWWRVAKPDRHSNEKLHSSDLLFLCCRSRKKRCWWPWRENDRTLNWLHFAVISTYLN